MSMVQEEYVSFEVAKLLREKGFNIVCWCFYSSGGTDYKRHEVVPYSNKELPPYQYSCPTQQMAMRWLREKKNVYIEIRRSLNTFLYGAIITVGISNEFIRISNSYGTYEEALEDAILYCLKNLI